MKTYSPTTTLCAYKVPCARSHDAVVGNALSPPPLSLSTCRLSHGMSLSVVCSGTCPWLASSDTDVAQQPGIMYTHTSKVVPSWTVVVVCPASLGLTVNPY